MKHDSMFTANNFIIKIMYCSVHVPPLPGIFISQLTNLNQSIKVVDC